MGWAGLGHAVGTAAACLVDEHRPFIEGASFGQLQRVMPPGLQDGLWICTPWGCGISEGSWDSLEDVTSL